MTAIKSEKNATSHLRLREHVARVEEIEALKSIHRVQLFVYTQF
jgi:hypothetical protein